MVCMGRPESANSIPPLAATAHHQGDPQQVPRCPTWSKITSPCPRTILGSAMCRLADLAFLNDPGRCGRSSVDGDVWLISGAEAATWRRSGGSASPAGSMSTMSIVWRPEAGDWKMEDGRWDEKRKPISYLPTSIFGRSPSPKRSALRLRPQRHLEADRHEQRHGEARCA